MREFDRMMKVFGVLFFSIALSAEANAMTVDYETPQGKNRAVFFKPEGQGPFPVIIFNHGAVVEFDGYEGARGRGYDLDGTAEALARDGFLVFAPLREKGTETDEDHVVLILAALKHVKKMPEADPSHIGMVGFSRGAGLSFWAARGRDDIKALALLAPAGGDGLSLEPQKIASIKSPVLLLIAGDDLPGRVALTEKLRASLSAAGKEVRSVRYAEGGGHELFWKKNYYWEDLKSFLWEKLRQADFPKNKGK